MNLADAVTNALTTSWSNANNFHVHITFPNATMVSFADTLKDADIDLNVVSISTPQYQTQQIETFTADKWFLGDGIPEAYRFTITFRDQDCMKYYRTFTRLKLAQMKLYPDDVKFVVDIYKEPDEDTEKQFHLFHLEECMIDNVSSVTFSNEAEETPIQFELSIKCSIPAFNTEGTTQSGSFLYQAGSLVASSILK